MPVYLRREQPIQASGLVEILTWPPCLLREWSFLRSRIQNWMLASSWSVPLGTNRLSTWKMWTCRSLPRLRLLNSSNNMVLLRCVAIVICWKATLPHAWTRRSLPVSLPRLGFKRAWRWHLSLLLKRGSLSTGPLHGRWLANGLFTISFLLQSWASGRDMLTLVDLRTASSTVPLPSWHASNRGPCRHCQYCLVRSRFGPYQETRCSKPRTWLQGFNGHVCCMAMEVRRALCPLPYRPWQAVDGLCSSRHCLAPRISHHCGRKMALRLILVFCLLLSLTRKNPCCWVAGGPQGTTLLSGVLTPFCEGMRFSTHRRRPIHWRGYPLLPRRPMLSWVCLVTWIFHCGHSCSLLPASMKSRTPWFAFPSQWGVKVHLSWPPSRYMACFLPPSQGRPGTWQLVHGSSWVARSVLMLHTVCFAFTQGNWPSPL